MIAPTLKFQLSSQNRAELGVNDEWDTFTVHAGFCSLPKLVTTSIQTIQRKKIIFLMKHTIIFLFKAKRLFMGRPFRAHIVIAQIAPSSSSCFCKWPLHLSPHRERISVLGALITDSCESANKKFLYFLRKWRCINLTLELGHAWNRNGRIDNITISRITLLLLRV